MNRTRFNAWLDACLFTQLAVLASTGGLIHWRLPPGSGGATLWGLDRHAWGAVHFWVAAAFVTTIALHLVLHTSWIAGVIGGARKRRETYRRRLVAGLAVFAALLLVAMAPLVGEVDRAAGVRAHRHHEGARETVEVVQGRMSLLEVERLTGVPVDSLRQKLGLPSDMRPTDRIGPAARRLGLTMNDVREAIDSRSP